MHLHCTALVTVAWSMRMCLGKILRSCQSLLELPARLPVETTRHLVRRHRCPVYNPDSRLKQAAITAATTRLVHHAVSSSLNPGAQHRVQAPAVAHSCRIVHAVVGQNMLKQSIVCEPSDGSQHTKTRSKQSKHMHVAQT